MEQTGFHLPRWSELPQIALYMDQVLLVMNGALEPLGIGSFTVTATMINNYVKMKLTAPAEKKKYTRTHVALFFMICFYKQVLSMAEIAALLQTPLTDAELALHYDGFCDELEQRLQNPQGESGCGFAPVTALTIRAVACKLLVEQQLKTDEK